MKYEVEKNIPIPPKCNRAPKPPTSITGQLRALKKGESIFIKGGKQGPAGGSAALASKSTGQKYTTRAMDGGVRIWRVS